MLTRRGFWALFAILVLLAVGVLADVSPLAVSGLTLLLWFGWEWLFFGLRARTLPRQMRVTREVRDARGPVTTLWAGRQFTVRAALHLDGLGRLPHVAIADPVPFGVRYQVGDTTADGPLSSSSPLGVDYDITCPLTGQARFEGLRVEMTDLQGFFAHVTFVREPLLLTILPTALVQRGGGPTLKRRNELPPPGIHRLRQPGSGSELLDLRDYIPGDPPRTIAWKVSARRDRLITKEFESEVPVRCTFFLDTSSSVRVPSPAGPGANSNQPGAAYFKPLDRLVELTAAALRAGNSVRDLTGLCLFDEKGHRTARPERGSRARMHMLTLLGEAAALAPVTSRADPEPLAPIAYALASEVYPDLMASDVNRMPAWLAWLVGFPRYSRYPRGVIAGLHRRKRAILLWWSCFVPLTLLVLFLFATGAGVSWPVRLALLVASTASTASAWVLFSFSLLASGQQRWHARMRKRLAALFAVRYGPTPGALQAILEDDDLYGLYLQQFLADHQVPCAVGLYDENGRYLFACQEKVYTLARALLDAVGRGRDNELFVLMADLLEIDDFGPVLQAVKVALGRHHQVLVLCPWPQGVALPTADRPTAPPGRKLQAVLLDASELRLRTAYERVRQAFGRLGVPVVCAASEEPLPLVLNRLERLRSVGGRR